MPRRGVVAWFNPEKGFGMIDVTTGDSNQLTGERLFLHVYLVASDSAPMQDHLSVEFELSTDLRGKPLATNVRAL